MLWGYARLVGSLGRCCSQTQSWLPTFAPEHLEKNTGKAQQGKSDRVMRRGSGWEELWDQ